MRSTVWKFRGGGEGGRDVRTALGGGGREEVDSRGDRRIGKSGREGNVVTRRNDGREIELRRGEWRWKGNRER